MRVEFDELPYGAYLAGRDTVFFNRNYEPIVRVSPPVFLCHDARGIPFSIPIGSPTVTVCRPTEWIAHDGKVWFYSDANPPRRNEATRQRLKQLIANIPGLGDEIARRSRKAKVA